MRLYPEDWQTRLRLGAPGMLATLFALAAGLIEDFVFGPRGNEGLGAFLVVLSLGLLALTDHDKDPSRSRRILITLGVLMPALHALVAPGMGLGEAYLRALREVPLGIVAFVAVRALDRRVRKVRGHVAA